MPIQEPRKQRLPQVRIVEASAGSGKTYALAKRYVELLFSGQADRGALPLKNILAITFSNKASLEMKERILLLLKKIALDRFRDDAEQQDLLSGLPVKGPQARQRALLLLDEITKNYNFFQVQTIDSFINAILSGCAFRIGLSAHFKIKTKPEDHLVYGLDSLLSRAQAEKPVFDLFLDFLHQYLYLENRTGWFPKKDILKLVVNLYHDANRYGGEFFEAAGSLADVAAKKRVVLENMRRLRSKLPEGTHALFVSKFEDFLRRHSSGFALSELSDYFARSEPPLKKGVKPPPGLQGLWENVRREIRECAELEAVLVFRPYIGIYRQVFEDFSRLSAKEDVMYLDELNRQAQGLFDQKKITVPELYYRLAMRLKDYLIDEFQDTSLLQWKNLRGMVEEALSVGGSLFYVGDKKQAIYRFRGGDVSLFDSVRQDLADFHPEVEFLKYNYRSAAEIVRFTNRVFGAQNLKNFLGLMRENYGDKFPLSVEDEGALLKVFEEASQIASSPDGGYVRLKVVDAPSPEEKAAAVKEAFSGLLEELKHRRSFDEMAVLVRENDEVELVSEWLMEQGIPVESEKTLDIRNNSLIKELVSFLAFLQSPVDNLSFVSFILGRLFARASGLKEEGLHDFVFNLRRGKDEKETVYYYREFRREFPAGWELIEEFFRNVGYVPLYELVVSIYRKFACLEAFPGQQAFFMKFLELIKEQEEDYGHLSSFLEFFRCEEGEPFYVRASRAEAVKVLTIHKAKGLGFPVVILPFVSMGARVPPVLTSARDGSMSLVRLSEKSRKFSPFLSELYAQEYSRCFVDELDAWYVALTRAREEMYLFLSNGKRGSNPAGLLLGSEPFEAGEALTLSQTQEAREPAEEIPAVSFQDWIQFLKDEFIDGRLLLKRHRLLEGEVCHKMLSSIGDLTGTSPEAALEAALPGIRRAYPFFEDVEGCREKVLGLLKSPSCRGFFYLEGRQFYAEQECFDSRGRGRRVDRILVDDKECWVVDYKLSEEEKAAGRSQVGEYMAVMADIYPGRRVRGFLVFLESASFEEVA